jgi:hypothetical protein
MISVEIKSSGTEEEARVQIGIWLSAWHERVGQLYANEGHRIITLPVVVMLNHYRHLYSAVDKGSHTICAFYLSHHYPLMLTPPGYPAVLGEYGRHIIACEGLPDTSCAPAPRRMGVENV